MDTREAADLVVPDNSFAMAHDTPPKQVSSGENAEPAARPSNAKSEALTNHAQVTTDTPSPHPSSASPPSIPEHALLWRIGGGSYGEVWLARNRMETFRAVKIVHRKTFERDEHFEREFKGIQKFEPVSRSHEGLVDILQIGRGEGYFYYVMELADDAAKNPNDECQNPKEARNPKAKPSPTAHPLQASGFGIPSTFEIRHSAFYTPRTLRAEQQRHGRLPVAECVRIGLTLTSALAHLHKQGLVHRDVKPSNIIFVDGVTKLADIGLVVETSEAKSFVGTMGFIPPEGPGTPQADLYSLGKVLYEISTGKDRQDFPPCWPIWSFYNEANRSSASGPGIDALRSRRRLAHRLGCWWCCLLNFTMTLTFDVE